jgi:outer membrane protein assembly factor BamB
MKLPLACVSAALAWAAAAFPADWTQFRGPQANPVGTERSLPDRWSLTQNIEWKAEVSGRGWSSPVVVGRRVFLTSVVTDGVSKPPQRGTEYSNEYLAELQKQGLKPAEAMKKLAERDIELPGEVNLHYWLHCLDLQSGRTLWKKEFHTGRPPGGRHRKNSFASETPVSDGQAVYVYAGNLGLWAFDLNGRQLWHTPLEAMPVYLDFGTGGSAALHGNRLFVVNDNEKQQYVAAFDKATGKRLWVTNRALKPEGGPRRASGWATPYIWANGLRTELITIGPGAAVSYDLEGTELWRIGGGSSTPIPMPFAYDGLLYLDTGRGGALHAVKPGAAGDISESEAVAWSQPRAGTYLPTPVAYEGGLYVLTETGILTRFDARTGKQSYKTRLDPAAGDFTASPWAYNGRVFFLNEEGRTFVVAAGENFELLHVNELDGEMALASPAIVGGRLLLRTETRLYSIRNAARQ